MILKGVMILDHHLSHSILTAACVFMEACVFKVNRFSGSLFGNILCCGYGLVDWIAVELKIRC